ncbi:hypothetical protein B0O80DRAFT_503999 [Mortierella sp. GBAus27b]|nr:hypothetical protein B0O80DRAFT_503999 [Mortierella sp. GBAus27b]
MLILPELDDDIIQQLSRQDLTQCARVNKEWHAALMPHLWKSLSCLSSSFKQNKHAAQMAFGRILLDDYLSEQQYRKAKGQEHAEHIHHPCQYSPSPLAKYGAWIQELPAVDALQQLLKDTLDSRPVSTDFGDELTSYELLSHLLVRAPAARVQEIFYLELGGPHIDNNWKVVNVILPRVCHLQLSGLSDTRILKDVLALCSDALTALSLSENMMDRSMETVDTDFEQADRSMWWISLKELRLSHDGYGSRSAMFWSWLWRQCTHVERLEVAITDPDVLQSLTQCMLTDMPNLDVIQIRMKNGSGYHMTDSDVEGLIAGSRKGWRIVDGWPGVEFGTGAMRALERHFPTLEELRIEECSQPLTVEIVRTLSSCPRLRSLITIDSRCRGNLCPLIDANVFADYDNSTGQFKTWACESTLKTLNVMFTNIPRPDLGPQYVQEKYPGQGRELQDQLYGRLARLTNLETLQLGYKPRYNNPDIMRAIHACLELSLESGLGKLSKLKSMKTLGISCLNTRIGVKEAQWMVEQWPKLYRIHGISNKDNKGAAEWLRDHYPTLIL